MINYSKKTLDKKEQQIKEKYKSLQFDKGIEIKTLKDLFNQLFNKRADNSTYLMNGKLDCDAFKGRSYYDAYRLCMNYFPELSFAEMYTVLRNYIKAENPEFEKYGLRPYFDTCPDIGRARLYNRLNFIKN